jgi:hypothetical protein
MRENIIIELSNGIKYTIIDAIEYNSYKYFLLTQVSKDETKVSSEFDICRYDHINNNLDQLTNEDEYTIIKNIFDERTSREKVELSIIHRIDFDELLKLEVVGVRKYDYKFKYHGQIIHKNIEFYSNTKPKIGDSIYISYKTLEDDMLSFGHIKNISEVNHNNVLVIERNNQRIYLRRYYG